MYNPKSLENLITFDKMDAELHRELSRRGGLASSAVRRRARERAEMLTAFERYGRYMKMFCAISGMSSSQMYEFFRELKSPSR